MAERIYVGEVSAYALARKYGYSGTEEEWAREQAAAGENARIAKENAEQTEADRETVERLATELTEAVDTAVANVESTAQDKMDAITEMGEGFLNTIADDGAAQIEAVQSTGEEWKESVRAEGEASVNAVDDVRQNAETAIAERKQNALTAIAEHESNAISSITTQENVSVQAVKTEKEAAQSAISSDRKNALDAVNKDAQGARQAIAADKASAEETIAAEKKNAVDMVKAEKSKAVETVAADKQDAVAAIASDKKNAQDAIAEGKEDALNAIASDRQAAVEKIVSDQAGAVNAIAADKKSAQDAIADDRTSAVEAIATDKKAALDAIASDRTEAEQAIAQGKADAIDAISADQAAAVSAIGSEREMSLAAIEEKAETQLERIVDVTQMVETISNFTESIEQRVGSMDEEQIVQNNRLDVLESHPLVDPSIERRLQNLEAAAKGYLYREDVNDNEAYEKTVPSDVMPWATLDRIGGKTIVMNQLIGDTYPKAVEGEMYEQVIEDEAVSASIDSIGGRTIVWNQLSHIIDTYTYGTPLLKGTKIMAGHKFLLYGHVALGEGASIEPQIYLYTKVNGENKVIGNSVQGNRYSIFESIYNAESDGTSTNNGTCWIYCNLYGGTVTGIQLFDITEMFGEGNEPTASEFRAMFPEDFYPYSAPLLMSFPVKNVECHGLNKLYGQIYRTNTTNGATAENVVVDGNHVTGTLIAVNAGWSNINFYFAPSKTEIAGKKGDRLKIVMIDNSPDSIPGKQISLYDSVTDSMVNHGNGYVLDGPAMSTMWYLAVTSPGTYRFDVSLMIVDEAVESPKEYKPYHDATKVDINTLIQKYFPDSMHSVGTAYDEIDLEHKVAIKRVGAKDLGTMRWSKADATLTSWNNEFSARSNQGICANYTMVRYDVWSKMKSGDIMIHPSTYNFIRIIDESLDVEGNYVPKLRGVMLYYELDEPIETPIDSDDLTNLTALCVEAGGSLLFENQHGDDYRVPVSTKATLSLSKWTQPLNPMHKYSVNGNLLTAVSNVDVVGGVDNVIDLTKAFGAGCEPNDPDEVMPGKYEQNSGQLKSFGLESVVSRGRNLLNSASLTGTGISGNDNIPANTIKPNVDGSVTWNGTASAGTAYGFFSDLGKNQLVHLTKGTYVMKKRIVSGKSGGTYVPNVTVAYKNPGESQVNINGKVIGENTWIFENLEERDYIIYWRCPAPFSFDNYVISIQFEKAESASDYTPYREPITYTYMDLTQKYFPEGMHSVGNVYDEINLERRVAIRRVGCVDLGTLTWASASGYDGVFYTTIVAEMASVKIGGSVISSHYLSGLAVNSVSKVVDGTICASTITSRIMIGDSTYKNATLFKTEMNGVMAFFELAEPIETPIAPEDLDGLTDINVEPGGSLVFTNGEDENYRIPVPNQETFIVKLGGGT